MQYAYAQALWTIISGGTTPKTAVKTLCEALRARGRLGLLPKIVRSFSLLASRAEAKNTVVLSIAREADANRALREASQLLEEAGVKSSDVKIDVRENLIGGWRLEGKEALHDNSYKKYLLSMYNRITIT